MEQIIQVSNAQVIQNCFEEKAKHAMQFGQFGHFSSALSLGFNSKKAVQIIWIN